MANCGLCGADVTFDIMQYYVPDFEGRKHRVCKQCSVAAANKALKYDPVKGRIVVVEKADIEIRKKCNVCGNVFCYNPVDLDNNKKKQSQAIWSAVGSIGGAMSGHYAASAVQQGNAANAMDRIVDYNKCPQCGSMDLRVISKEELAAGMNYQPQQQAVPQVSLADELKKLKELQDLGIITQEEFNTKKQEYLSGRAPAQQPVSRPPAPRPQAQAAPPSPRPQAQAAPPAPRPQAQTAYAPAETEQQPAPNTLPSTLFKIISVLGILFGLIDVYSSTDGFQECYEGVLEFMVGSEPYSSAWFAVFVWIIFSLFAGFLAGRFAAKLQ